MRYNPFQPNRIVNPGMFVGRVDEIKKIEHYLFQTKSRNPQNFLIEGERGIGKSSLLHYVSILSDGRVPGVRGERFNFLLVSVDMGGVTTQFDIVRTIGRELKSVVSKKEVVKEKAKKAWEFLSNWEVLGVRYHKAGTGADPEDAKEELVEQIAVIAQSDAVDGVVILIDEADAPPVEAHLGEFLKTTTERLSRIGTDNVVFGLAGLPSLVPKLRASHESSPRIFTILKLDPLEIAERKQAIQIGIDLANERNSEQTRLERDALDFLADLSEGYPHFVQQFSYCAFEADEDFIIDEHDVARGAYGENGAIHQLGSKYFAEAYVGKINSDDYRKVLHVMADHGDEWVTRRQLIRESGLKETTINNALAALKQKQIILADESRAGHYRLPTRSFAAWINALKSAQQRGDEATSELPFDGS